MTYVGQELITRTINEGAKAHGSLRAYANYLGVSVQYISACRNGDIHTSDRLLHKLGLERIEYVKSKVAVRLKPQTVRVTTHDGEILELPEPWWDVPDGTPCYYVDPFNYVKEITLFEGSVTARTMRSCGNVFRTCEDAQAWADAMPKIKGGKRHGY